MRIVTDVGQSVEAVSSTPTKSYAITVERDGIGGTFKWYGSADGKDRGYFLGLSCCNGQTIDLTAIEDAATKAAFINDLRAICKAKPRTEDEAIELFQTAAFEAGRNVNCYEAFAS